MVSIQRQQLRKINKQCNFRYFCCVSGSQQFLCLSFVLCRSFCFCSFFTNFNWFFLFVCPFQEVPNHFTIAPLPGRIHFENHRDIVCQRRKCMKQLNRNHCKLNSYFVSNILFSIFCFQYFVIAGGLKKSKNKRKSANGFPISKDAWITLVYPHNIHRSVQFCGQHSPALMSDKMRDWRLRTPPTAAHSQMLNRDVKKNSKICSVCGSVVDEQFYYNTKHSRRWVCTKLVLNVFVGTTGQ